MSKIELLAKIELLNKYEAMMEELKAEADTIRNTIKAEMEAREVEELIAGQYIVRYTAILSNRFDSTAFKSFGEDSSVSDDVLLSSPTDLTAPHSKR